MVIGIDHVQLAMAPGKENKARGFFGELLGMREIPKPESLVERGGVWFEVGCHQLHLGVTPDFVPATKGHPCFAVESIDVLAKTFLEAGHKIIWDDNWPGHVRFYVPDPFGNRLEFLSKSVDKP